MEVEEASRYSLHGVIKYDFLVFYLTARKKAFISKKIRSAFRRSGLVPLNSSEILDQLIPDPDPLQQSTASQLPQHLDDNLPNNNLPSSLPSSPQTPKDYTQLLKYYQKLEK